MIPPTVATYSASQFDIASLVRRKGDERISVCLPARNEEATVGDIVATIHDELVATTGLVDEIIVIDDHSDDATAAVASAAGAVVLDAAAILADEVPGHGKGEALWRSLHASTGDIVVWCDADITNFTASFVTGLVGPLLADDSVVFVKGFYERPIDGDPDGGGRVTELMARPALALLFPELTSVIQPLAGECAGRRTALEKLSFARGYGVDIGLVIDVAADHGICGIAQVDLGSRHHRNRPYDELSPMATEVLAAVLGRAQPSLVGTEAVLRLADGTTSAVHPGDLPPLIDMPELQISARRR